MKKYFIFAAIAAAGLLTSCSSSDDAISGVPGNPTDNQDDRTPIVLGISTTASTETRGTGTVGSTDAAGAAAHKWDSQKINVFMFVKNSLELAKDSDPDNPAVLAPIYDNTVMTAPDGTDPDGAGPLSESYGLAKELVGADPAGDAAGDETHTRHRYYPMGNQQFDFWGYYIDNATHGDYVIEALSATVTDEVVKVPFKIDGSQDLMAAKAKPTTSYANLDPSLTGAGHKWPTETDFTDALYSSSTARQDVHPNLSFKHLLTRFHFQIQGGNFASAGWTDANTAPAAGDTYTGVFLKSVEIESKTEGKIIAAYTSETPFQTTDVLDAEKLTVWDGTDDEELLALKSTTAYGDVLDTDETYTDGTAAAANAGLTGMIAANTVLTAAQAAMINNVLGLTGADAVAEDDQLSEEVSKNYARALGYVFTGDVKTPKHKAKDLKPLYDFRIQTADLEVSADPASNYAKIIKPESSSNTNYTAAYKDFGSALLVKPGEAQYRIKIVLGQYLLDREEINPADPTAPADTYIIKEFVLDSDHNDISALTPPGTDTKFKAGNSYAVRITVYGAQEIKIYTELEKWHEAGDVDIDMD